MLLRPIFMLALCFPPILRFLRKGYVTNQKSIRDQARKIGLIIQFMPHRYQMNTCNRI